MAETAYHHGGGISTSRASVCQQLSLGWISVCIQLRTFIPVESSSAWHWGPAGLLKGQWFMCCWVREAGSSQRSPGRVARCTPLCVFGRAYEKVCIRHCYSLQTSMCVYLRSCTRAKPNLPAGCRGLFGLDIRRLFDCAHACKGSWGFRNNDSLWKVEFMSCADWLGGNSEWRVWISQQSIFAKVFITLIMWVWLSSDNIHTNSGKLPYELWWSACYDWVCTLTAIPTSKVVVLNPTDPGLTPGRVTVLSLFYTSTPIASNLIT